MFLHISCCDKGVDSPGSQFCNMVPFGGKMGPEGLCISRPGTVFLTLVSCVQLPLLFSLLGISLTSPGLSVSFRRTQHAQQRAQLSGGRKAPACLQAGFGVTPEWPRPLLSPGSQCHCCYPTASPVKSSIPLTPPHHHGNTGSRLSQRQEILHDTRVGLPDEQGGVETSLISS